MPFKNPYFRVRFLISPILFLVSFAGTLSAQENLAFEKPCQATSEEGGNLICGLAFDGTLVNSGIAGVDTRWGTDWRNDANQDSGWIWVDLEDVYSIDSVAVHWEHSIAAEYDIQVWEGEGAPSGGDGAGWVTVLALTGISWDMPDPGDTQLVEHSLDPVNARYVRIRCYKRFFDFGFSIFELEVFGGSATAMAKVHNADIQNERPSLSFSADRSNLAVRVNQAGGNIGRMYTLTGSRLTD